ncbi:hypothetical protein BD309DRAFT_962856 [Dichomitus squalens]|nr:hypothetical protein BD309DRAFT_962856 [Dichomitus squalens]
MSSEQSKPQPCNSCRWRKVKCLQKEGAERCHECHKRGEACERGSRSAVANNSPCEECKRAHVACDMPRSGPCARCGYLGQTCTRAVAGCGSPAANPTGGAAPSISSDDPLSSRKPFFDVVLNQG